MDCHVDLTNGMTKLSGIVKMKDKRMILTIDSLSEDSIERSIDSLISLCERNCNFEFDGKTLYYILTIEEREKDCENKSIDCGERNC